MLVEGNIISTNLAEKIPYSDKYIKSLPTHLGKNGYYFTSKQ